MSDLSLRELVKTGLLAAIAVLAAVLVFYGVEIVTGSALFFTHDGFGSDFWHTQYPIKAFYAEELRAGRLPLWCPGIGAGFPLHAAAEIGSLYPVNLLLFALLPLALALNWSLLMNLVLAGMFAAMLARQLGAGRIACVYAATTFAFSGFFVTHLMHSAMIASAVWAPLLFLLLERHAASGSRRSLVLLSLTVAVMACGAHPQIVYYNLLFAAVYGLFLLIEARRSAGPTGWRRSVPLGGRLLLAVLAGLLIAAPQLMPTRELRAQGTVSSGLSVKEATRWQYRWEHLVAFVNPDAFGHPGNLKPEPYVDPATGFVARARPSGIPLDALRGFKQDRKRPILYSEMTGYAGLLTLLLAITGGVLGFRRRRVRPLLAFLALALLLALGREGGLFHLLHRVLPGYDQFRFHDRFLLHVDLWLALLAALGLSLLAERMPSGRSRLTAALLVVAVAVNFVDLKLALGDHNPKVATAHWLTPSAAARTILAREGEGAPFRIFSSDPKRFVFNNAYWRSRGWTGDLGLYDPVRDMLAPNLALLHGLSHLDQRGPLQPPWSKAIAEAGYRWDPRLGSLGVNPKIVSLYNVRYLLDPHGVMSAAFPKLAEFPGDTRQKGRLLLPDGSYTIGLHENPAVLPRAFLVPAAQIVEPDLEREMQLLESGDFDPRRRVLLAAEAGANLPAGDGESTPIDAPVEILSYTPQRVSLRTDAPRDCWLFISDTWYPGWRATVDGVETEIHRANVAGRAIRIPAGSHSVTFSYEPESFRRGLLLALAGVLLLLILFFGTGGRLR